MDGPCTENTDFEGDELEPDYTAEETAEETAE